MLYPFELQTLVDGTGGRTRTGIYAGFKPAEYTIPPRPLN